MKSNIHRFVLSTNIYLSSDFVKYTAGFYSIEHVQSKVVESFSVFGSSWNSNSDCIANRTKIYYTFFRVICQKSKFKFWYFIYKYDTFYENFIFYFRVCHSLPQYRDSTFNDYRNKKRCSSRQTLKRKAKMFSDWHKALVSKTRNIFLTASTNISRIIPLYLFTWHYLFYLQGYLWNELCTYIMSFQCYDVVA